jgi:lipid-A-disaccharide synthase
MILPNPDVIIFIDYPGFNMRIAKWAREKHPNTLLHIAPNMGLENRITDIKKRCQMYVILPFEKHFMKTNIIFRSSLWVTL